MSKGAWEPVIGLEVHVQLATESKMFCGCKARVRLELGQSVASEMINSNTCPICSGHPGTLPAINRRAVEFAIRAGIATGCSIRNRSVFSRKNYFYPDLPKGYQISQYDQPICEGGALDIELDSGGSKRIGIERIHLEEDAGKNVHMSGFSVVNLNRAGIPLVEIVSRPDLRSSEEAGAYLRTLYSIVTALGICDGNLQEGNFRCDANVSVRPTGATVLGTRAEIKNVNSFRFVEKAIDFEIARQIEVIEGGGKIIQETRTYDSAKNKTTSMRSKEEAHDYRYFPEPDLVPLLVEDRWIEEVKRQLPELPQAKRNRWQEAYGISDYDARLLSADPGLSSFFEGVIAEGSRTKKMTQELAKTSANLISGEVARLLKEEDRSWSLSGLSPARLFEIAVAQLGGVLSSTAAKQVLGHFWVLPQDSASSEEATLDRVIDKLGVRQVSDLGALEGVVRKLIADFPEQAAEYRAGKDKLLGFFVGQAMKASQGKANPQMIRELLEKIAKG